MKIMPIPLTLRDAFEEWLQLNDKPRPVSSEIDGKKNDYEIRYTFDFETPADLGEFHEDLFNVFPREMLAEESMKSFLKVHEN